jgi:hypothetical protein
MSYTGGEIEIRHYVTRAGKDIFDEWLTELADFHAQAKVTTRINRLATGNFVIARPCDRVCTNCASIGDRATGCISR